MLHRKPASKVLNSESLHQPHVAQTHHVLNSSSKDKHRQIFTKSKTGVKGPLWVSRPRWLLFLASSHKPLPATRAICFPPRRALPRNPPAVRVEHLHLNSGVVYHNRLAPVGSWANAALGLSSFPSLEPDPSCTTSRNPAPPRPASRCSSFPRYHLRTALRILILKSRVLFCSIWIQRQVSQKAGKA